MRTTFTIPDDLMETLRVHAARAGSTVSDVVVEACRHFFDNRQTEAASSDFRLVTFGATAPRSGVWSGVHLDESSALLAAEDAELIDYDPS